MLYSHKLCLSICTFINTEACNSDYVVQKCSINKVGAKHLITNVIRKMSSKTSLCKFKANQHLVYKSTIYMHHIGSYVVVYVLMFVICRPIQAGLQRNV